MRFSPPSDLAYVWILLTKDQEELIELLASADWNKVDSGATVEAAPAETAEETTPRPQVQVSYRETELARGTQ